MIYPQLTGEPNFVLIGVSAVFGLLVIIMIYYIFISKNSGIQYDNENRRLQNNQQPMITSSSSSSSSSSSVPVGMDSAGSYASATPTSPSPTLSNPGIKQVFNITKNIYTLDDAPAVCGALGADLASINQLVDAHKSGADWCNVGWTKDGLAAFPLQKDTWTTLQDNVPEKRNMCGSPGINLVRNDPNLLYGVNCYGVKPEPKGNEKVKNAMISDKQFALNAKIAAFQKNMNDIGVAPFNASSWSR